MLFSSITFLYWFLPLLFLLYFLAPMPKGVPKIRNWVLLAFSVLFYAWGEPIYVLLMIFQSFSGWGFGLLIEKFRGSGKSKAALVGSLVVGFGCLMIFKYTNFFAANVNALFGTGFDPRIILPIGISFYTFQILSYDIDLYRGDTAVQRNFLTFSTYVMLFPQLIAGPIVRYADVAAELHSRKHSLSGFSTGARRFVLGLAKKVLLANTFGELVDIFKNSPDQSVLFAWLYIVAYAFHIYFDFSGYSDMAIGLGRIFGFRFLENFNYPYIAKSVTEFWRRWHMSLSSWFRDYVYIPLGGNRVSRPMQFFNILVVWFLTGFWHGAGWNFIIWGLYFAALLMLEKLFLGRLLKKLPPFVSHLYLILCVLISWVFFDASSLPGALGVISRMFGVAADGLLGTEAAYYFRSYFVLLIVAVVGVTPLPKKAVEWLRANKKAARMAMTALEPIAVCALLLAITSFLVDGSFNPFIYFRF